MNYIGCAKMVVIFFSKGEERKRKEIRNNFQKFKQNTKVIKKFFTNYGDNECNYFYFNNK